MGNAVKRTEVPRFRSNYCYGPDCPTLTVYGPSEVDSSQYEEVSSLVNKLLRGELTAVGSPVFDSDGEADPEAVINDMPVTRTPGFDLSDASVALKEGKEALRSHEKALKDKEAQDKKAEEEKNVVSSNPPAAKPVGHEGAK